MTLHRVHLGLGSNVGNRHLNIDQAVTELRRLTNTTVLKISRFIETEPVGGPPQGKFLNAAILIRTEQEPLELLMEIKAIERQLGRRRTVHWGPRTIDIDILTFDDRVIDTGDLKILCPTLDSPSKS